MHSYESGVPFAVEERSGIVTVIRELEDFDLNIYEFEAVAAHVSQFAFLVLFKHTPTFLHSNSFHRKKRRAN